MSGVWDVPVEMTSLLDEEMLVGPEKLPPREEEVDGLVEATGTRETRPAESCDESAASGSLSRGRIRVAELSDIPEAVREQLDIRFKPCNFAEMMPRLKEV